MALILPSHAYAAEAWKPLFNGRNLDGWVPKVNHRPLGENWKDTFRVRDGVLVVSYDQYDRFGDAFGHLFYRTPFSSYRLRLEYRFTGPQTPGAPAWALRNSGVMLHSQDPATMALDQTFPISVEAQFLGGAPGETRPTANVCTPGVTVSIGGVPMHEHCRNAAAPTFPEGEWVRFEVEVRGDRLIRHVVNGQTVFEYGDVRLAPAEFKGLNADAPALSAREAPLDRGWIALQSEGHPVEFRKIEILKLR
ncbi:MAG: DUF1080 domain-containing protein [Phenylobacterium zucineum]|nr:MAG: DUF1080 domain-containing protein [Phenylobacterium zucineum]